MQRGLLLASLGGREWKKSGQREAGISKIYEGKLRRMMPRRVELIHGVKASLRGSTLGFILGLLLRIVSALATFLSHDFEKPISKYPNRLGTGVIEGVAEPESANHAPAQAGVIPVWPSEFQRAHFGHSS
jgi:TctA family transporter